MKKSKILAMDEANADVLVQIITGANISENLRIQAMEKLTASKEGDGTFWKTMMEEKLSYGACPKCQHENHWCIPEDDLNQMGWVTAKEDERVKEQTTEVDCPEYQQACAKKRITT